MRPKSVSTNNSSSPKRSPDAVGTAFSHSPHTPGSVGGGGNSSVAGGGGNYAFNDALTVDSWSTTMTAMLQPHKSQRNTFQCPTHLSFTTKDPLDVCPHCERQQQLNLQERRRSVEKQLRDMDMTTNTTSVANDILQDLQSTVQQWKQPPAAPATPTSADGSHTTQSADNTNNNNNTSNSNTQQQQQQQNLSRVNSGVSSNHSAGNTSASNNSAGGGSNHQTQAPPQAATPPLHPGSAPNSGGVPPAPPPNPMAATMQPPPPPMVPSFGATPMAGGAPGTTSGTPLEALALQIQGMQRMQDWMLYQKEQECQQLRQRLDAATQQINTLAVENALLQEKLNQQEQRMKHELKLIKLAALQQQQQQRGGGGSGKSGSKNGDAASQSNHNNNNGPMVTARGNASSSNVSVSSHHSGGSGGGANGSTADSGFGGMVLFPNADAMAAGGGSNNGGGAQPKTSVVTSALTHQDQSIFQASGNASTSTPQMNGGGSGSGGFEPQSPAHVPSMGQISLNGPPDHQQQQGLVPTDTSGSADSGTEPQPAVKKPEPIKQRDSSNASGPIDLDDMTEMIKASKAKGSLSPAQKSTPTTLPSSSEDDFSYQHIPRDIQIEPSLTGGTATDKKAAAQAQAPPDKSGTASADISKPWPDHVENPAPNVNFPDASDNMSVGNTVASSTYGEDRQQVTQQVILDPYGDRGTYTGVILRSTGMPHGSGRMIYQEDKRTYDGEWRHGRWHGYGRATFANGDHYHGEYRFDQRHGRGRYEWNDGRVYDGLFREDKRHGRGVFTWPDGAVYEGDFRNGQREGHGTYRFSDGGRYEGSWKDGRYNGFGICNWEDGRCYKGEWLNGMAHGKGVETFADGTVRHDGQWIEDEPVAS